MKSFVKLTVILSIVTIINSCNHSTEPEPQPGRRDYTWTVDTINPGKESLYMLRIWGAEATDVWAVGSSSWSATSIWHYNGIKWSCDSIPRRINPSALFGISKNDVWLGNTNSTIWRYYGQWELYGKYKVNNFDNIVIEDFDGTSPNNIYGVGFSDVYNTNNYKAVIMHFNGYKWDFINIPDTKVSFVFMKIDPKSSALIISGMIYDPSGFVPKAYCWDGKNLIDLPFNGTGDTFVTRLGDEIFVSVGSKVYKYSDKRLSLWKDNTNTSIGGRLWCGRSRNDFFIRDVNGISHYNGTDYSLLYKTNLYVGLGTIFENDVFFIAYDHTTGKNYVIHGQLK